MAVFGCKLRHSFSQPLTPLSVIKLDGKGISNISPYHLNKSSQPKYRALKSCFRSALRVVRFKKPSNIYHVRAVNHLKS